MRAFAERLRRRGVRVRYIRYEDPDNAGSLPGELFRALGDGGFDRVVITEPGEWRLREASRLCPCRARAGRDPRRHARHLLA
jgi:deoxyribodipyrimidine photolyase-related protein